MIELIFLDVDGCLTDGKIIYTQNQGEIKEFDVKDGAAIEAWLKLGKKIAIITGRNSSCVDLRAKDLKIEYVYQGIKDKLSCAQDLLKQLNLDFSKCAGIGDYFNDQKLLSKLAMSFRPKDGHKDLKVDYVLSKKGGKGAVCEMIEFIVKENNQKDEWDKLWL